MLRIYRLIRKLLTWLFGGVLLALAGEFAIDLGREHGLFAHPTERVLSTMDFLTGLRAQPWFWPFICLLAGLVAGMWVDSLIRYWRKPLVPPSLRIIPIPQKIPTQLRLQFNGTGAIPLAIDEKNIWNWYILGKLNIIIHPNQPQQQHISGWQLFICFDQPVNYKQIKVDGGGTKLPITEVRNCSSRHAIITFADDMPAAVVTIEAML